MTIILIYVAGMVISAVLLFKGKFPGWLYGADWNDSPEATGTFIFTWPVTLITSMIDYFRYGTFSAEVARLKDQRDAEIADE